MAKVIIIGAGGVGNVVAQKCAQVKEIFSEILLGSRTKQKCDAIAKSIAHPSLTTAQIDADKVTEMVALINDFQPDIVINVALPYQDLPIMDACLETGVNYLDTANYEPPDQAKFEYKWQWNYHERYKQAGIMAVLGCGFDPGVDSIAVAAVAAGK
ncbi:saccharopine dehydrogenase NADP-binding domain-containing protein [Moorena sp. SIO4A1]|uniref:saccharopine dehydrogenase family protein n=1 Tax=Moorena sp. SIO4A1 TaxID=2607835 RepID=UPI0025F2D378|nr:saccharopine dehydrogenase NADP-binding domain-containing protein [Moorena sp. SIO4A1]